MANRFFFINIKKSKILKVRIHLGVSRGQHLKIVGKSQTRNKNGKNVSELGYPGNPFWDICKKYKKIGG
jgi:hypothetical protein